MQTEVVSVTSRIPGPSEPYYRYATWLESLQRVGVAPTVLGMGEHWQGLMTKPRRLREWLRGGGPTKDLLIVCDSYDVVFTEHPNSVGNHYIDVFGTDSVVFNAERGLFPRQDLAGNFKDPGTPWMYLNSGFFIGTPANILQMLESMQLDDLHDDYQRPDRSWVHVNDQAWYQVSYCLQAVPQRLDSQCEVCQCCSACSMEDFDLSGERVRNVVTGTEPMVWHFNGGSKNDLMEPMLAKWGLA
jgi:hypothetical protein